MKKALWTTLINRRHRTTTHRVRQCTQKPTWCEKEGDVWPEIFADTKPTTTPHLRPQWNDTGNHTFELTGQKTGDTASDHEIAMQTLDNDWNSYDTTIYTDGAATHGSANGGSGIIITTGPRGDPRVHRQCTILAGKWCSSFKAEVKVVWTTLKLGQENQ